MWGWSFSTTATSTSMVGCACWAGVPAGRVGDACFDLTGMYTGSLHIFHALLNAVKRGDRVAQLILEVIQTPEVEEVAELPTTVRGAGGYGSTGVRVAL